MALAAIAVGCGSEGSAQVASTIRTDADFSVCQSSPAAVRYAPGMTVLSTSGAYRAAIESASTDQLSGAAVPTAAIGYATFSVAVTVVADGGVDGGGPPSGDLAMTAPPASSMYPANPYMPLHGHGASTVPAIAAQGSGVFTVSQIDFFMGGYWQLYLELTPAGGAPERLTFNLCIPDD